MADFSGGLVVRSLRQDPAQALSINSTPLSLSSSSKPGVGAQGAAGSQENTGVHNLEVGGQSFMISTPGASNGTIDWGPTAVQINRATNGGDGVSGSNQMSSSSGVNSDAMESMNISPRQEQMDQ